MTKDEFMKEAIEKLMELMPEDLKKGLEITTTRVMKMNDQELNGLVMNREGVDTSPTIYIDHLYEKHLAGDDTKAMMMEVLDLYKDSLRDHPEIVQPDLSYESIKDNVSLRLIELKRNRMYLVDVPYMSVGNGFAVVCDIKMDNQEGSWRTTITREILEKNGYDKKLLFTAAMRDAWEHDPPVMMDMSGQLLGVHGLVNRLECSGPISDQEKSNMYVLSNESGVLGASALFYPGVQEHIAEQLGESYYVLPSSVHEVLIVPESAGIGREELSGMVRAANNTVVEAKDVLSDNVMHYDKDEKQLSIASPEMSLTEKPREEARC